MDEIFWNRMNAETLRSRAAEDAIVILPLGSTEQHGPHLATGVDDMMASEIARRVALKLQNSGPVVVTPSLWCGLAEHHMDFGGTFTLRLSTYHALLRDLCDSIRRCGFRRIVIINGHGGNAQPLAALLTELSIELDVSIAITSYFVEGGAEIAQTLEDQVGYMHACEAETSLMMAVHPDLVFTDRLHEACGPDLDVTGSFVPTLRTSRPFSALTSSGVAGTARRASAAKGEDLAEIGARTIAAKLTSPGFWPDRGA